MTLFLTSLKHREKVSAQKMWDEILSVVPTPTPEPAQRDELEQLRADGDRRDAERMDYLQRQFDSAARQNDGREESERLTGALLANVSFKYSSVRKAIDAAIALQSTKGESDEQG